MRSRLQGVSHIILFNWPYFFGVGVSLIFLGFAISNTVGPFLLIFLTSFIGLIITTTLALIVSWWIYDMSALYTLSWLNDEGASSSPKTFLTIHSGFDETSDLLRQRYSDDVLMSMDFYDPHRHTSASIRRARNKYLIPASTIQIDTSHIPVSNTSIDGVFLILAVHEIRSAHERTIFFEEIHRILKPNGFVYVVEHLRDWPNALAFSLGVFHFHSRNAWCDNFKVSHLSIMTEFKITPFLTVFKLSKL